MKATVFDSYALISFLEREDGYDEVSAVLDECVLKDRTAYTSVVNWGEVLYHGHRHGGEKIAKLAEDTLKALPIQVIDADKELTRMAAELKAYNKMSYADCFAAALAIRKKCELLTGDKEFKQVENKIKIRWIK